jgi:hypothetical protein
MFHHALAPAASAAGAGQGVTGAVAEGILAIRNNKTFEQHSVFCYNR